MCSGFNTLQQLDKVGCRFICHVVSAVKVGLLPDVIAGKTGPPLVSTPFVVLYVNDINRIIMTFVSQLSKSYSTY